MIIQQIRNATLKIEYDGITFLTDPWFQDPGTGFSAKAVKPEMRGIKCPMNALPDSPENNVRDIAYCLVTHLHFDHFCPDYLPRDLRIIVQNQGDAEKVRQQGFGNVTAFESGTLIFGDVVIHKTKAIHGDSDEVVKMMGEVCGYVFEAPREKCLYLAADTIYCSEVEQAISKYHPETIILNCCEATTPLGRLIMNVSDVEKVCQAAPWARVIASHLDSVNHALLTRKDIIAFLSMDLFHRSSSQNMRTFSASFPCHKNQRIYYLSYLQVIEQLHLRIFQRVPVDFREKGNPHLRSVNRS